MILLFRAKIRYTLYDLIITLTTLHDLFDHSSTKFRPYVIEKIFLAQQPKSLRKVKPFSLNVGSLGLSAYF